MRQVYTHIWKKEFPEALNKMLNCNSQLQPISPNENRSIPHKDRQPYNNFKRGINSWTRTLTTPGQTITHTKMAHKLHHFSHTTHEIPKTHYGKHPFTKHCYQGSKTVGHEHHTAPFRMTNTSNEQQGIYHRGSPKLKGSIIALFHMSTIMRSYTILIKSQLLWKQYL